jgi:hypothetical protein
VSFALTSKSFRTGDKTDTGGKGVAGLAGTEALAFNRNVFFKSGLTPALLTVLSLASARASVVKRNKGFPSTTQVLKSTKSVEKGATHTDTPETTAKAVVKGKS